MSMTKTTKVIILAGGEGKRMKSHLPKVLATVKGKPMIKHLLEAVEKSGVCDDPAIVVGFKKEMVINELGDKYHYVTQEEQLGTGHAVLCAHKDLKDKSENILVLYGDNPFVTSETIKKLVEKHLDSNATITMATVVLPDFKEWREFFYTNFSRIIRDKNGNIIKSVESKDATDTEKEVKEVNPCYFCFKSQWLWEKLQSLENNNAQKEYYLTDLVKMAIDQKMKIESIPIDGKEAMAANSKEELELLENFRV